MGESPILIPVSNMPLVNLFMKFWSFIHQRKAIEESNEKAGRSIQSGVENEAEF